MLDAREVCGLYDEYGRDTLRIDIEHVDKETIPIYDEIVDRL